MTKKKSKASDEPKVTEVIRLESSSTSIWTPKRFKHQDIEVLDPKQPSLFDPLEETLNLSPAEKESYRAALRTIDNGSAWAVRQSITLMAYNFFSASKDPTNELQSIETPEFKLTFTPSFHGTPTLYDADILMFVTSVLADDIRRHRAELDASGTLPYKTDVVFRPKDFAKRVGKSRNSRSLKQFQNALDRLAQSSITIEATATLGTTKMRAGQTVGHFIDGYKFVEIQEEGKAPVIAIQVRVAEWIVRDIARGNMLWFPDEYFRLSPFEKLVFMAARSRIGLKNYFKVEKDGTTKQLPLSLEELRAEPQMPKFQLGEHVNIDYFYYSMTLQELAEAMRFKQPLKKLKTIVLEIIRNGTFPIYEVAIDQTQRMLRKNVVYFFRKDNALKRNLLAAELRYPDFKEKYASLTTRAKLLAADKRKAIADPANAPKKKKPTQDEKRNNADAAEKAKLKRNRKELHREDDVDIETLLSAEVQAFMRRHQISPDEDK